MQGNKPLWFSAMLPLKNKTKQNTLHNSYPLLLSVVDETKNKTNKILLGVKKKSKRGTIIVATQMGVGEGHWQRAESSPQSSEVKDYTCLGHFCSSKS